MKRLSFEKSIDNDEMMEQLIELKENVSRLNLKVSNLEHNKWIDKTSVSDLDLDKLDSITLPLKGPRRILADDKVFWPDIMVQALKLFKATNLTWIRGLRGGVSILGIK